MDNLSFLDNLSEYQWPVIIKKTIWDETEQFIYPKGSFDNLRRQYRVLLFSEKLIVRRELMKSILDLYMKQHISLYDIHFCLYQMNAKPFFRDFSEKSIGKRRYETLINIPKFEVVSNDDFISYIWTSLIDEDDTPYNPYFKNVRLLFSSEQFDRFIGRSYADDPDWIEPISRASDLDAKTWTKEKDPMIVERNEEYSEGQLILGTDGGGLRHFINGEPISAGSYIEVRFGDGWLPGRYEWSFIKGEPIRIHNKNTMIYIQEGHRVRINK